MLRSLSSVFTVLAIFAIVFPSPAVAEDCGPEKIAEVIAPADGSANEVMINCSLKLEKGQLITKRMVFEGAGSSGITIDCNSARLDGSESGFNRGKDMIEIRSRRLKDLTGTVIWERPEDIVIRGCNITGSIRIWGMAVNGQGVHLRDSSRRPGHIERARASAPTGVTLENLKITGTGRIPLYIAPGVTHVSLRGSWITGRSDSVAIYLDAESSGNVIRDNTLHIQTGREMIAIDGSSKNEIAGNSLYILKKGGIYLYRNCGEGGTIRHSAPEQNTISGNHFFYDSNSGDHPAIYTGSRRGSPYYCNADSGYPFGSSISDLDHARDNTITGNRFHNRSSEGRIKVGSPLTDSNNRTRDNLRVFEKR